MRKVGLVFACLVLACLSPLFLVGGKGVALSPIVLESESDALEVGFGAADITPRLDPKKPVYIAGFGHNRQATRVHDPLMARAIVLRHQKTRIALVSVDLVGYFHPEVVAVRKKLPGYLHVLVSSTHNHEGPDTLGLWGKTALQSGIDPDYLALVRDKIVQAVQQAEKGLKPATAVIGTARAPELIHDSRDPQVKHDELVALKFLPTEGKKPLGIVVQWNNHPETLADKNTELSADFVGVTVKRLQDRHGCPVVYFTGTVGGLMTTLRVPIKDSKGNLLKDGTWEKTERYGELVADLADRALKSAKSLKLTPLSAHTREVFLPLDNPLYKLARQIGVLKRDAHVWANDPYKAEPLGKEEKGKRLAMKTEVGWLRLGELDIAAIPGEIYPELVLDKVQDPPDAGADFPKAPIEPAIYKQMPGPHRMLIGLASDEIGYIIPKRQWDEKPPFCYGKSKAQYGEQNSLGPETAPLLCEAFRDLVKKYRKP